MYIDEKIAALDRLRRENIRQEMEKEEEREDEKNPLTIGDALAGIREGKLQIEGMPMIEFDFFVTPVKEIPIVTFKNFYDARQENEEGIILLKRGKEISQIVNWPKAEITPITFEQWGNLLVNGMAANRLHVDIIKKEQLKHMEYICYEVPSGKGPVYNVVFRFKKPCYGVLGNYNCMSLDRDTFGIIFEAMLAALDQWADADEEAQDGKNSESGNSQ